MKRNIIISILIGVFMIVSWTIAAEQNKGAKDVVLQNTKGDVAFPHLQHQEAIADCNICHSDFAQTPGSIAQAKAEGKLEKKQIMNKHCIKCHKEKKNAEVKHGPLTCSGCHK